jgi:transcriptional regulator with XRE-family HTH domain
MLTKLTATQYVSTLAAHRQRVGMTQRELAIALDMTEVTVQNWERGRVGAMQIQRIVGLCSLLGCPVEALVVQMDGLWVSQIQTLRKARGLKQRQLALALEVTERTIKSWEKGDAGIDVIVKLIELCRLFDCRVDDLIQEVQPASQASDSDSTI